MPLKSDAQLVQEYAENGSEAAFAAIVNRHTNLVYSCAFRQVGSPDHAAEIAQNVFVGLARGVSALSPKLSLNASLAGWLCRTTRNLSLNFRRDEFRRQSRERQAMENLDGVSGPAFDWEQLRPVLDEAMSELSEPDYDALVMRFYQSQDLRAVGLAMGVSDDTAQKRVARALEKLRELLSRRGVTTSAAALSLVLAANAVQSAPAGLAAAISAAATVAGTASITTAIKTIVMTTLQKTLITTALIAAVGAGVFEALQASHLREQIQQQQTAAAAQQAQLQAENDRLSRQTAQTKDDKSLSQAQLNELLKLRGQATQTRTSLQELAKLKASPSPNLSPFLTNAMALGLAQTDKFKKKAALAKLDRMKVQLGLSDDQAQAISDLMMKQITNQSQLALNFISNALSGKQTPEPGQAATQALTNGESEIEAQLTPGQLAAYPDFKQSEIITAADNGAKAEVSRMTDEMSLSQDQQNKLYTALYQLNLNQASSGAQNQGSAVQALPSGNFADAINSKLETQEQTLAAKLQALDGILTPEQLTGYKQQQSDQLRAMKMFLQPATNGLPN